MKKSMLLMLIGVMLSVMTAPSYAGKRHHGHKKHYKKYQKYHKKHYYKNNRYGHHRHGGGDDQANSSTSNVVVDNKVYRDCKEVGRNLICN